eukprot:GCRY01001315.1.p1 GENE.GCRY01001315.1~~GCRY01001315.1.p1  ORF type:complete len:337 (-),score=65.56 GCRY01001315.1:458-1468(-)
MSHCGGSCDSCSGTKENPGREKDCEGCPSQQACQSQNAPGGRPECAGCPMRAQCQSGQNVSCPSLDTTAINERMGSIKHKILVLSGKGGVGKSTFSSQLAQFLADQNHEVGLLDVDICGPSIPKIMGLEGETIHQTSVGWSPVYVEDNLGVMSIGFLLQQEDTAVIWRGPKKNGIIKQFLQEVDWTDLDYLVVDSPPGTSDEHISIAQFLKDSNPGAVIVTTPQEVSIIDVRKEVDFCRKVNIPILGLVENMSGFVCPNCDVESPIFPATAGGGEALAKDLSIPFLGRIPIDPVITKACDEGVSFLNAGDTRGTRALKSVFEAVKAHLGPKDMEMA